MRVTNIITGMNMHTFLFTVGISIKGLSYKKYTMARYTHSQGLNFKIYFSNISFEAKEFLTEEKTHILSKILTFDSPITFSLDP